MAEISKENEKKAQELYTQLQMYNENAKQIHKQLQMVEGQYVELAGTSQSLKEFGKSKKGSKILVPLNSGIFVPAELSDNDNLVVNVGANVAVSKNVESTLKLIDRQVEQLKELRDKMALDLNRIVTRGSMIEEELKKLVSE
ncbi:prefoldin subunit alpha [Candidatus Woesearchaeota archaeon]|nr:prefoldin subunit alpha [Candidatus Woesearchaeota archaeon]MBI2130639.1 prefoldin subunit alpha [Candidatus Woesearchaeota archaeon]